jgi:hypothetical protein
MIKRIKSKGTEVSYQYLFYVYDLIGEVYPTIYTPFGFLRTYQNWLTSDELDLPPLKLDTGLTLDQPYGTDPEWFLDYGAISALITRHFIIAYGPQHIENDVPEFMSEFTAQALHNDVMQTRRKIEIPHYEFFFTASAPLAGTVQLENWTDLDNTVSYDQQSIRVSNVLDFSNAAKVQFGSVT